MPEIGALQRRISDSGLDAAVLTSYETVSPFARTNIITQPWVPDRLVFFLVPASGPTSLLVCNIEENEVRATTTADEVRTYVEFAQKPTAVFAELLRERGLDGGRVGFELERLAAPYVEAVRSALPALQIEGADDIVQEQVSIKTADEIASIGEKGRLTARAVDRAIATLRAGMTEAECCKAFMWELVQTGGRPEFMVFGSGAQTLKGHPVAGDIQLQEGILWRVDFGARWSDGYLSDLARSGVVGDPSPAQEETMAALLAAQQAAFAAIEPGRPANDLWKAASAVLESAGLRIWAPHLGHSIGVGVHERPQLAPSNDTPLVAGTVLNIEPFVAIPEREEGYHTEDLVLVTEDGFEVLTEPQTELLRIAA